MKVLALLPLAALLALPSVAQAGTVTFGSDLTAPASIEDNHQADVLYFNAPGQVNSHASPVDGEVIAVRIKGTILPRRSGAETKQIDKLFHIQTLRPNGNNSYTVLTSSDSFYFPFNVSPDTISSYRAESPHCVSTGDIVDFNDIGGWQGDPGDSPGTRYQIFARSPGSNMPWYSKDQGTNIGTTFTTEPPYTGHELLMQVVVATGYDAATNCPGGRKGREYQGVTLSTPDPAPKVYDDGVARVRVLCPENTYQTCDGTVKLAAEGKDLGSNTFKLNRSQSTNVQVRLSNEGAGLLAQRGTLTATAMANTHDDYGVAVTTTGPVKLTSARAATGGDGSGFFGTTAKAQTLTYRKGKQLSLKATCPAGTTGACTGRISIKSQTRIKLRKSDKKGRVYSLASAKYAIEAGKTAPVAFKLTSSGLKALKAARKIAAIATISSQDGAGHTASKRVKVTFKYKG